MFYLIIGFFCIKMEWFGLNYLYGGWFLVNYNIMWIDWLLNSEIVCGISGDS